MRAFWNWVLKASAFETPSRKLLHPNCLFAIFPGVFLFPPLQIFARSELKPCSRAPEAPAFVYERSYQGYNFLTHTFHKIFHLWRQLGVWVMHNCLCRLLSSFRLPTTVQLCPQCQSKVNTISIQLFAATFTQTGELPHRHGYPRSRTREHMIHLYEFLPRFHVRFLFP